MELNKYTSTEDVVENFKSYVLCGGYRDDVLREIAEYILCHTPWIDNYDRSVRFNELVKQVYTDKYEE